MTGSSDSGLGEFERRFQQLRGAVDTLSGMARSSARQLAPRFNIFKILGVGQDEVRHSAVLRDLLDPEGTHGQGAVFLEAFLQHCWSQGKEYVSFPRLPSPVPPSGWVVENEKPVNEGRLDIVVQLPRRFLLVIENKIGAPDRPDQLRDYTTWLARQRHYPAGSKALIYLTPDGRASQSAGDEHYFRMSYGEDLAQWLEASLRRVEAFPVNEIVRQYVRVVKTLGESVREVSTVSGDDYAQAAVDFLRRPENLKAALEISDLVESVKDALILQFGRAVEERVRTLLPELPGWSLERAGSALWLSPCSQPKGRYLGLGLTDEGGRLYHGICWNEETKENIEDVLRIIRGALPDPKSQWKSSPWWPAWRWVCGGGLRSRESLLRIADGSLAEEIAAEFIDLIKRTEAAVRKANDRLAAM